MRDADRAEVAVRLLDGADDGLIDRLARLVNEVYAASEDGLWQVGMTRTTAAELAGLVAAGQLAVAEQDGEPVGCVQVRDAGPGVAEFGLLAASPERRGSGVGRTLVGYAEGRARDRGQRAMRLELLVPREWRHPHKEFLKAWYERLGYRLVGTTTVAEAHPHLTALQATPCDVLRYEKSLVSDPAGPAPRPACS